MSPSPVRSSPWATAWGSRYWPRGSNSWSRSSCSNNWAATMPRVTISAARNRPRPCSRSCPWCPAERPPTAPASSAGSFIEFPASQADSALDLPLQAGMQAKLDALGRQQPSVRQLQQAWQDDPTLTGRLLAAANSRQYNTSATPCLSLGQALQILGPTTSLNIGIGLGLNPASQLDDAELRLQAEAQLQQIDSLHPRVAELDQAARLDPAPLHSAALLYRMGELCLLQQAQLWHNAGHSLSLEKLSRAMDKASSVLANRLKAHWRLPTPLRDLIGACYALPTINTRREAIVMHLAASEQAAVPDADKLARLRRLAGLP